MRSTGNSIRVSSHDIYAAFTDPSALATWLAPGDMTGVVHTLKLAPLGGYEMTLTYPDTEVEGQGKTTPKEDRFVARFIELSPPSRIVESISFDSDDPQFAGEMIMDVTLDPVGDATLVTINFTNIPEGIRLEDNSTGTDESLKKLARYVGGE